MECQKIISYLRDLNNGVDNENFNKKYIQCADDFSFCFIVDQHNTNGDENGNRYTGRDVASVTYTSGFRCPIRNKGQRDKPTDSTTAVNVANYSAHLKGGAVDYNITWPNQSLSNDNDRKRLSILFYNIFSDFESGTLGAYLYGKRISSAGAVLSGSISFKRSGFLDKNKIPIIGTPDPSDADNWPLRYIWKRKEAGITVTDTISVCYIRAHTDIRHER